jgi:hypothetical protein
MNQRFEIGTKFHLRRGKTCRDATIVDVLRTVNSAGEVVKLRYVAEYEFMGQTMRDVDVLDIQIAKALHQQAAA